MQTSGSLLPIPRLRLTRRLADTQQSSAEGELMSSAGPSSIQGGLVGMNHASGDDDAEEQHSTPRVSPRQPIPQDAGVAQVEDTPAARLRALLQRVPNSSARNTAPDKQVSTSPSILESDFDSPNSNTATPSMARETLKDLFSRALREPGDTPHKARHRSNSFDLSEGEPGSHVMESTQNKGKWRSLSDEELDKPSSISSRKSQAATFKALRERLNHSSISPKNLSLHNGHTSESLREVSQDTATLLRELNSSQATPPAATSTPQRLLQMQLLSSQSNLLEHDSEMHRAMKGLDSYSNESPINFPSFPVNAPVSQTNFVSSSEKLPTEPDLNGHSIRSKSPGLSPMHKNVSKPSSEDQELTRERERDWNKHTPKPLRPHTPDTRHSHGSMPRSLTPSSPSRMQRLSRRSSTASLRSLDSDPRSSRTSSIGSPSEYHERLTELEKERNRDREREWNKPHPKLTRSTSSLGHHSSTERPRTHSQPTHPEMLKSFGSPNRHSFHSHENFSFPSRSSSPTSSTGSRDEGKEQDVRILHEIEHERERNWNAPRPKWHKHPTPHSPNHGYDHHRAASPIPPPSPSSSGTPARHRDHLRAQTPEIRTSQPGAHYEHRRPRSPIPPEPKSHISHSESKLGSPHSRLHYKETNSQHPASSSPSFKFPRSRTPLPPLELDRESPEKPRHGRGASESRVSVSPSRTGTKVSSKDFMSGYSGRIPVLSSAHNMPDLSSHTPTAKHSPKHRDADEQPNGSHESPLHVEVKASTPLLEDHHQEAIDGQGSQQDATPTMRTVAPPDPDTQHQYPTERSSSGPVKDVANDEARLQRALATPVVLQEASPPVTSPSDDAPSDSLPVSLVSTPPRPPSRSSRMEFPTPSPPKGLPDLPGPPSSSEEEEDNQIHRTPMYTSRGGHPDLTTFKTPHPPGAFAVTPAPQKPAPGQRSQSPPSKESRYDNGLATPAASLSRTSTLQTPAPPGAWAATPNPRKSILKVRFDTEHPDSSPSVTESEPSNKDVDASDFQATTVGTPERIALVPEHATPLTQLAPRTLRKSPSIRILDAYGRETSDAIEEPKSIADASRSLPTKRPVRIVDAMGRDVDDTDFNSSITSDSSTVMDHNEALSRVRRGLVDLAHDLSDMDRSQEFINLNQARLEEIDNMSRSARETREKLSQTLQMAQTADDDLRSKLGSLQASVRRSKILENPILDGRHGFRLNAWFFWGVLFIQLVLVVVMYRLSNARAKDLFLTTYYDPFYADLHIYAIKPDSSRHMLSTQQSWSIFSMRDTLYSGGWKAMIDELWTYLTSVISEWQRTIWENWGIEETRVPWPPT